MPELTPSPDREERVVARIESGDIGLIGEMLEAAGRWAKEEHPECKLLVRNAPGVAFELFLSEKGEKKS
jgi:hypothetical protein